MCLMIGKVTKDATVSITAKGKNVVNFSIALNKSFFHKGKNQWVKDTTYVRCSYWLNTGIAKHLTKGAVLEITGFPFLTEYEKDGKTIPQMNVSVDKIEIHAKGQTATNTAPAPVVATTGMGAYGEPLDDLPF